MSRVEFDRKKCRGILTVEICGAEGPVPGHALNSDPLNVSAMFFRV
jgi:hypothetical protein